METYNYEATTKDGNVVTGTLEVANESLAIDRIQDMGYFPMKVSKADDVEGMVSRFFSSLQNRITDKDIMTFTYQLGVLLDASFPLDRSLSILSDLTEKRKLRELVEDLNSHVRSGKSFSDALSRYPKIFPLFFVNMVKAGEAGGFLEDAVSRLSTYLENSQGLKEEVRSALVYPMVLVVFGGASVVFLLTYVVPMFTQIFTDMDQTLPLPTLMLLALSNFLTDYWFMILLFIAAAIFFVRRYLNSENGNRTWDSMKFKLPIFGKLYQEVAVSRFSRTLGTLLASGVPILNAFQIVKGTLGSEKISGIISSVREAARKGRGISESLKKSDIFPPIAIHMVTIGEETGKLDEMLIKIADRFDIEVRTTVKRMLSLLEPALIIVMAVLVGFIVISMLLAIFSLSELPL
ncbi:type II secretion system protein F [bacterium BMS3Abin09]|nr:type II secretion system protein F [bacterium BMS3Abin09]GBE41834.1 type II secretion system protein F [bacterium BMS3Bbin09]HDO67210.1 type II secretion system F family protein [Nitrospirota bacterium]HEW81384.1 type II secretion system F family protein [Nitrospirota bacterium]